MLQDKYSDSLVKAQFHLQDGTPARTPLYQKAITDAYVSSNRYNCFLILEDCVLCSQLQQTDLYQNHSFAVIDKQDAHDITTQSDQNLQCDLIARLQGA